MLVKLFKGHVSVFCTKFLSFLIDKNIFPKEIILLVETNFVGSSRLLFLYVNYLHLNLSRIVNCTGQLLV